MTINRESIQARLPPGFNVQHDGDSLAFTTTHEGKAYETTVDLTTRFPSFAIEGAIRCCQRFNEEHRA